MRTVSHQPTATNAAFKEQLQSLRSSIRHHWDREPALGAGEREQVLSELLRLDLTLERLLFTARRSSPSRIETEEFDRCRRSLERLVRKWPDADRPPDRPDAPFTGTGLRLAS